ncbi:1-acyl-sn-glycerol-3-phosphate acyltransferase [Ideonella sp. A 288]|uniref:lysophospholipid acyltransferase family protein n=1 Tax=Ideonella sp. A 288 TaxID=1962181 RepID=UPI000B4C0B54|nr:1-acyl-sn-glycerol-3-phosphate acyltransferase [Ideonella sp. A 288]
MRGPIALWRLARTVVHVLHGMAVVALAFPRLDDAGRHARIAWWAGKLLRLLGIRVESQGLYRPGASLLVSNHVSWLDILAIHAVCPQARFVSKADVKHWPLLGWLVASAGTLFIERERKRDALRVVHQMAEALTAGHTVGVFPEGTTGDGRALLPFHANLLQAAIATGTPVQPVCLHYREPGHATSPTVGWVGDTTLVRSLWDIAGAQGVVVRVVALPPVASVHADRRALAEHLRELIAGVAGQGPGTA